MNAKSRHYFEDLILRTYDKYAESVTRLADAQQEYSASYSAFQLKCTELAPLEDLEELIDDLWALQKNIGSKKIDLKNCSLKLEDILRSSLICGFIDYKGISDPRREIRIAEINIAKLKSVNDLSYALWQDVLIARQRALQESCKHNLVYQTYTEEGKNQCTIKAICAICQIEEKRGINFLSRDIDFLVIGQEVQSLAVWLANQLTALFVAREEKDAQKMQQINGKTKKILSDPNNLVLASDCVLGFLPKDLNEAFKEASVFVRL